jgi:hypothetical protein
MIITTIFCNIFVALNGFLKYIRVDFGSFPFVVILLILLLVGNLDFILRIGDAAVDMRKKVQIKYEKTKI